MIKYVRTVLHILLFCIASITAWNFWQYHKLLRIITQQAEQRNCEQKQYFLSEQPVEVDDFIPVNRTVDYLRDTAVSFANEHDLGDSVRELYQADEWTALKNKQKAYQRSRARKRPSAKKKIFTGADLKRWQQQNIEKRFVLPIDKNKFWLSSPFGHRKNPDGSRGFHHGIDMASMRGTPVKAAGAGTVVQVGHQRGYGKVVVIKHDEKFKTRYAHLSATMTSVGRKVQAGDIIGRVGSTGNARASGKTRDASHLHFEVEVYGRRMNPFYFFK